jgi:hypothetical protein
VIFVRRGILRLGALIVGAPLLLAMDAVPPPRPTTAGGDCPFPAAPVLSGVTAMASPGRVTLSWSAAPPGNVVVTREGSDRSSATFPQTAATSLNDTTVNPFVSRYTYTLQPVNCFGQGRPATASVTTPPFHLLVTYDGGVSRSTVACNGDCSLTSLNLVTSCGLPGATPYLPACDFSGVLLHKGSPIDAAHPLPVGGAACSSTTVLPPGTDSRLELITGIVTKGGASAPWKGSLVTRPTYGQMLVGTPWGTADLVGTLRLVYQCPPGTLTP